MKSSNRRLTISSLPAQSYRVSARGFCVAPARALDGDGSVLLTRFDFAGLVTFREDEGPPVPERLRAMKIRQLLACLDRVAAACANAAGTSPLLFPDLEQAELEAVTKSGTHRFKVWIAADDRSRGQGLMRVRELPPDRGMLFL